jgi:hypothetical protein
VSTEKLLLSNLLFSLMTGLSEDHSTRRRFPPQKFHLKRNFSSSAASRVTRLGEFSPFAQLLSLGSFLKITVGSIPYTLIFGQLSSTGKKLCTEIGKLGWATVWAIFSQTHLVTVAASLLAPALGFVVLGS